MTKREIASLALKLLGIYMIIQGINVVAKVYSVYIMTPEQLNINVISGIIFPFLFLIAFGVLLWLMSNKLADVMIKENLHSHEVAGIKVSDIQRTAFSVVGLFFLGDSFPKIIGVLINLFQNRAEHYGSNITLLSGYQFGGIITQFILGLGIVHKAWLTCSMRSEMPGRNKIINMMSDSPLTGVGYMKLLLGKYKV